MTQENQPELTEARQSIRLIALPCLSMRSQMNGITMIWLFVSLRRTVEPDLLAESADHRWVLRKKRREFKIGTRCRARISSNERSRIDERAGSQDGALCEDESVIGTPFFVMEWVEGRIIMNPLESNLSPDELGAIYRSYISTAAKLHLWTTNKLGLRTTVVPGTTFLVRSVVD